MILACVALLLLSPWIVRLARVLAPHGAWPALEVGTRYTAMPYDLLLIPRNLPLAMLAAWGITLGIWRRHRGVIVIGLWLLSLILIVGVGSAMVPPSAVVITLFLPVAMLIGYFVSQGFIAQIPPRWHPAAGAGLIAVALLGAVGMRNVINPTTMLLTRDDMDAITWVQQNTSPDARFLINSRPWQGNIYVGTDAGYWLSVLAERETVPPPGLYVLGSPTQVENTNRLSRLTATGHIDPRALQEAGITHVFLGSRGGPIDVAALLSDPTFELLHADGNAWVFRLSAAATQEEQLVTGPVP